MSFVFESSSLITLFVGENFRHLAKTSSLFPDEFFPDKVFFFQIEIVFLGTPYLKDTSSLLEAPFSNSSNASYFSICALFLERSSLQICLKIYNVLKSDSNNRMLNSSNYREKIAVGEWNLVRIMEMFELWRFQLGEVCYESLLENFHGANEIVRNKEMFELWRFKLQNYCKYILTRGKRHNSRSRIYKKRPFLFRFNTKHISFLRSIINGR